MRAAGDSGQEVIAPSNLIVVFAGVIALGLWMAALRLGDGWADVAVTVVAAAVLPAVLLGAARLTQRFD